jgi:hypothetical protein
VPARRSRPTWGRAGILGSGTGGVGPTCEAWIARPSMPGAGSTIASETSAVADDPRELPIAALERRRPDHFAEHVGAHGCALPPATSASRPASLGVPRRGRRSRPAGGRTSPRRRASGRSDGCPRRRRVRPRSPRRPPSDATPGARPPAIDRQHPRRLSEVSGPDGAPAGELRTAGATTDNGDTARRRLPYG